MFLMTIFAKDKYIYSSVMKKKKTLLYAISQKWAAIVQNYSHFNKYPTLVCKCIQIFEAINPEDKRKKLNAASHCLEKMWLAAVKPILWVMVQALVYLICKPQTTKQCSAGKVSVSLAEDATQTPNNLDWMSPENFEVLDTDIWHLINRVYCVLFIYHYDYVGGS